MKLRPTALASLLIASILLITSCEKDAEKNKVIIYAKSGIAMTGAQVMPASPSTGSGTLNVTYSKTTKTLIYSITWSGLSDSVIAIRISGLTPVGYSALNPAFSSWTTLGSFKPFADTTTPYSYYQQFTNGNYTSATLGTVAKGLYPSAGTFSGTLQVDGAKINEVDLLNGVYYVTIHTKTFTAASPASIPASVLYRWYGEVRGQIRFQ